VVQIDHPHTHFPYESIQYVIATTLAGIVRIEQKGDFVEADANGIDD
jgi:hypothetical protein